MAAGLMESRAIAARYGKYKKFAAASDQWLKVAEASYENFRYYVK